MNKRTKKYLVYAAMIPFAFVFILMRVSEAITTALGTVNDWYIDRLKEVFKN